MFLKTALHRSNLFSLCLRRHASHSSLEILKTRPELYNGVLTNFGWVLVRKTHVARGWTQTQINKELKEELGKPLEDYDLETIQEIVDNWTETANVKTKPKSKKKTALEVKLENEMKLFLQQARYDEDSEDIDLVDVTTGLKQQRKVDSDSITFTYAWNYFMATTYPKYSNLPHKEARQKVGIDWKRLSLEEKEHYRQEYSQLLKQGKDILHGEIVDREVKQRYSEKLWETKERKRIRKLGMDPNPKSKMDSKPKSTGSTLTRTPKS